MGTFDRSRFKATKTSKLKQQQDKVEDTLGTKKGGRANFLKLKPGKNKVRILPSHPGSDSFCYPRTTHYLEVMAKYKKDGVDVEELKKKPIFNAKVHAAISEDPIDAYIDKAYKLAFEEYGDDEKARNKFMSPITNYKTGIKGKTRWVVYAILFEGDERILGRLDLPVSVKEALNDLAIGADDDDDVIETDPFTDPDEGRCVVIKYNDKATTPGDYYKTSIDLKKATPLTDDELDWLEEQPSLQSMLVESYTMKDFDLALEGLERFDKENDYEIFTYSDFLDTLESIAAKIPEAKDDEPKEEKETKSKKDEVVEKAKEEEEKSDLPFDLELEEMDMSQLKGVIRREGLDIRVLSKYDEEDVVEMIKEERELKAAESESPEEETESEEVEERPRRRRRGLSELSEEVED